MVYRKITLVSLPIFPHLLVPLTYYAHLLVSDTFWPLQRVLLINNQKNLRCTHFILFQRVE